MTQPPTGSDHPVAVVRRSPEADSSVPRGRWWFLARWSRAQVVGLVLFAILASLWSFERWGGAWKDRTPRGLSDPDQYVGKGFNGDIWTARVRIQGDSLIILIKVFRTSGSQTSGVTSTRDCSFFSENNWTCRYSESGITRDGSNLTLRLPDYGTIFLRRGGWR